MQDVSSPAIVLVDDEPEILFSSQVLLRRGGFGHVHTLTDSREVIPVLEKMDAAVLLLDLQMPHVSGRDLLADVVSRHPDIPVVVVTAANEIDTAVACMKAGAFDYLVKPFEATRYLATVHKALELSELRREVSSLRESLLTGELRNGAAFSAIVTRSRRMTALFGYLEAVAPTEQPVLITGETGAGKELVARAIHTVSGRGGPFIPLNAPGLDDHMFADTLFGHRKGAFTGATEAREGMIARAAGGTLFLDEIGDLSPASQVKLLRLLQEGEYYPVGADAAVKSRARIVVATNRDLRRLMEEGTFRSDLFYRLNTHHVRIPPLRERREDVPPLLQHFIKEAAAVLQRKAPHFPPELVHYLEGHMFPGNVRELKAMVYDAVARHKGAGTLSMAPFIEAIGASLPPVAASTLDAEPFPTLEEMENSLIDRALRRCGGNQGAAANLLGISRQALNKRLRRR